MIWSSNLRHLFIGACCFCVTGISLLIHFTDFHISLHLPDVWRKMQVTNLSTNAITDTNYTKHPLIIYENYSQIMNANYSHNLVSSSHKNSSRETDLFSAKITTENIYSNISNCDWQAVGKDDILFVYCAHFDDVSSPVLRVIAIVKEAYENYHPKCALFSKLSQDYAQPYKTVVGYMQYVPWPKRLNKYRSATVICPLKDNDRPVAVTILLPNASYEAGVVSNLLHVPWKSFKTALRYNLTLCVPPLQNQFNGVSELLQMFAFGRKFGTERFVVYNMSVSKATSGVLELFIGRGVLEVHPWNPPVKDVHYFGQHANIQDCIYRNLHVSRYVLTADVDELLVPRSGSDLLPVVWRHLHDTRCGVLQFMHFFFPKHLPNTNVSFIGRELAEKYHMDTLLKTLRISTGTSRQKMAIDPTRIEIAGVHSAEKYRTGFTHCIASLNEAFLHHYRTIVKDADVAFLKSASGFVNDTYLHKFSEEIVKEVDDDMKLLGFK